MRDQADQLRHLVRKTVDRSPELYPGPPLVVISGGARGVGATTLAVGLTRELARLGRQTVLVDANLTRPDVANQMNLEAAGSLADVLSGSRSVSELLQPAGPAISVLPGRWLPETPPDLSTEAIERFFAELQLVRSQADVVVIDAGAGMSPWADRLWQSAQLVLLTTTLDPTAVLESYATVKLSPTERISGKLRLVINRAKDQRAAERIGSRFAATCFRFLETDIHQAGIIGDTTINAPLFHQSLRLLAADVVSSCLVAVDRVGRPFAPSAVAVDRTSTPLANSTV